MNPNENNPIPPVGAGGAMDPVAPAPGMGSVDFTNSAALESNNMDMTNGAAMPSNGDVSGQMNIDGTTGGMTTPMPPLTPAEPVPGSIGSVTSVPPLAPEPMDMGSLNNVGNATASNMPVMGQAAESKPPVAETPANGGAPYYNPFTRNAMPTNGGAVDTKPANNAGMGGGVAPETSQPKTDKFSDRLNNVGKAPKKSGNTMMLLGWLLAVLFLVSTVVMAILWQSELHNEKIVYYPSGGDTQKPGDDEDSEGKPNEPVKPGETVEGASVLKCGKDVETVDVTLENLSGIREEVVANYADGGLLDLSLTSAYTFADVDAATAAKPSIDAMKDAMTVVEGVSVGVEQLDSVINFGFVMPAELLAAEGASLSINLPTNEDGTLDTSVDAMKGALEADGYVCVTE